MELKAFYVEYVPFCNCTAPGYRESLYIRIYKVAFYQPVIY